MRQNIKNGSTVNTVNKRKKDKFTVKVKIKSVPIKLAIHSKFTVKVFSVIFG